jgi:chromosome segregation ATPase
MTDQPNPLCEERFENLGDSDEQTKRVLEDHGRTLMEHTQRLDEHTRALAELKSAQERHGDLLTAMQTNLAQLVVKVSGLEEQFKRSNDLQAKLLFMAVAALIILAGIQKLGDLGVL